VGEKEQVAPEGKLVGVQANVTGDGKVPEPDITVRL
jgi:hypothetical protein